MTDLFQELFANKPVVTDGAWGTQFQNRGLAPGELPEKWNLEHPERVVSVAQAYVDAGSRVILTNSFGGNGFMLASEGLDAEVRKINAAAAQLSREAAGDSVKVFGSIGPTGKMLMMGDVTEDELEKTFTIQAEGLAEGGADALVIETMADLQEALLALKAAQSTGLPVVACMVYDSGAEKDRTMMGVSAEDAAKAFEDAGADAVGANCGTGIENYIPVCRTLRNAVQLPVWIKPNAGLPEMVKGKTVYQMNPEQFASHIPALLHAGADFVGGCCGTSPEFIQTVVAKLKG